MNLQQAFLPLVSQRTAQSATVGSSGFFSMFGATTKNGIAVNEKSALTLSAFYNGIEIITNDFAKLPKSVYQKLNDSRKKIGNHPVQYLISTRPNQYMTSFMFDKMMLQYAILKGNGYAYIERNNSTAKPISLQLIDQESTPVTVIKHNKKLFYKFGGQTISADDMLHVPGFSSNGITGVSVITAAANSLNIALSSQEFGADYYHNKGIGTGVLTTTTEMDPDAKIRYGDALGAALSNKNNQFKVAVVDEAGSFQHIKITPQEAQFLTTNKYGIEEIARWLNIPPHKLKSLDNVNNSISENQEIQHVSDSIVPWARKFEQEYNAKLFTGAELANGFYIKANEAALLRADKKTQAEFISKMINIGVMTRNEGRSNLDLNALPGLDSPLQMVNTVTQEQFDAKLKAGIKYKKNG